MLPQLFILRYKLPTYQCNTAVVVAIAFISGNKCHVNSDCLNVTQLESVGDTESEWKNNIKLGRERERGNRNLTQKTITKYMYKVTVNSSDTLPAGQMSSNAAQ